MQRGRKDAFAGSESCPSAQHLTERQLTGALLTEMLSKSNDRSGRVVLVGHPAGFRIDRTFE